jgi:Cobalamin-independent synthase, Catalytic domain
MFPRKPTEEAEEENMATVPSESHLPAVDKHCHKEVGRELQGTLVDLDDLSLLGKQLPWPGPSSATTSRAPTPPASWRWHCTTMPAIWRRPESASMSMNPRCASCCRRCGKRTNRPTWTHGRGLPVGHVGISDAAQVHTHLCYSDFGDVINAVDGLDADVTSLEAARSRMQVLPKLAAAGFVRGIGPGAYTTSPRVPPQ